MKDNGLFKFLRGNIREYSMYIALFVIMAFFAVRTNWIFMKPQNIANLLNQMGFIAVMAVGMTLVIVIRQIDLSVGYLAGFLGAIAAIALKAWGLPVWLVIPLVLVIGTLAGLGTSFLVSNVGIPAFVATLAGWLIYHGALQLVTGKDGTIIISDKFFKAIGNDFIPDPLAFLYPPNLVADAGHRLHVLTLVIGVIAVVLLVIGDVKARANKKKYNFEVITFPLYVAKLVFISALLIAATLILATFQGMSWIVVITLVIVLVYHFVTTQTVLGRHIYAVGGNPEAAELSGISVKKITYIVFGSMGFLSAISGILIAARQASATTTAGAGNELDAIAAAYIGGVSAAGGVGKVTGTLVGALVYFALTSGMNLPPVVDASWQLIMRGAILALFVIVDVTTRKQRG